MKKGFTIIEMIVVIAIIAVLSGVALMAYAGFGQQARDSRRKVDLETIRQALELYRSDNGNYPIGGWWGSSHSSWSNFESALVPDYISQVPKDPRQTGSNNGPCAGINNYRYSYKSDTTGQLYVLTAIMEDNTSDNESKCRNLSNWAVINCSSYLGTWDDSATDVCYGVQNP